MTNTKLWTLAPHNAEGDHSFEDVVARTAKEVQRRLATSEKLSSFYLNIKVSGRTHGDNLKVEYEISRDSMMPVDTVKGGSLEPVIEEFMRRVDWKSQHLPKAIPDQRVRADDTIHDEEDDIPF